MFEKKYKNKIISEKYYNKYLLLNNFQSNLFSIPKVLKKNNNSIFFEEIKNFISLNNELKTNIDFEKIGTFLYEIHYFFGENKIDDKQYIHGDFCLQNILKTNDNKYYVIDFESPKEYEDTNKYYYNNPYIDLGIFIMKLITSKPIYISFFINYKKQIILFLKGYNENINKKLLSKYINIEINRFLNGIKSKSKIRYFLWKIYFNISKIKFKKWKII